MAGANRRSDVDAGLELGRKVGEKVIAYAEADGAEKPCNKKAPGGPPYSGAAAEVLTYLFPKDAAQFNAKADEASNSRLWGGIHWRADNETGLAAGRKVGALVVERAKTDGGGTG